MTDVREPWQGWKSAEALIEHGEISFLLADEFIDDQEAYTEILSWVRGAAEEENAQILPGPPQLRPSFGSTYRLTFPAWRYRR